MAKATAIRAHRVLPSDFRARTLGKKELSGTTLAITQIFSDEDSAIVTNLFHESGAGDAQISNYEEFIALRDSFIRDMSNAWRGKNPFHLVTALSARQGTASILV